MPTRGGIARFVVVSLRFWEDGVGAQNSPPEPLFGIVASRGGFGANFGRVCAL